MGNIINLHEKDISVDQFLEKLKEQLDNARTDDDHIIRSADVRLILRDVHTPIGRLLDDCILDLCPNRVIKDRETKQEILLKYASFYNMCNTENMWVTSDSIFYYRNFNRFSIGHGSKWLMDNRSPVDVSYSAIGFFYSLEEYMAIPRDDREDKLIKLQSYCKRLYKYRMDTETLVSQAIYILHHLFTSIDPDNEDEYRAINMSWDTRLDPREFDRDVKSREANIIGKADMISGWIERLDPKNPYRFYSRDTFFDKKPDGILPIYV